MKWLLLLLLFSTSAIASENITCILKSGDIKASATLELSGLEDGEGYVSSEDGVYDLSFDLQAECNDKSCEAWVTLYSQILEDEAGQSEVITIERGQDTGRIYGSEITESIDNKNYALYCYYN